MSAAPTLKELVRALTGFVQTPSLPLPDDLVEVIEAFLYKRIERWDESSAEKVNDELLSFFKHEVAPKPPRYAAFIAILRRLRPLIGQPARVLQWFELLQPLLTHLSRQSNLASESQGIVLDILTADDGNDTKAFTGGAAGPVAEKIILLWFRAVESLQAGPDASKEFKEKLLKETLILYGKKRPKDLMGVINQFVCKRSHRASSLLLLSSFIQSRPPHLYLILQTPLFDNLLICLQEDTSTTIISLALTVLIMVLPHVPSSLVSYLPKLFNIYARLLFWERELPAHGAEHGEVRRLSSNTLSWEVYPFAPESDDTTVSQLLDYFTILYGLYPINFMDYIRKPQRYLRHAEAPDADDIEVQPSEIRHASERFRQCHVLHENFYTLTIDSEKVDFGRWIKSEPAEVVADCMALRHMPDELLDPVPVDLDRTLAADGDELVIGERESALLNSTSYAGMSDLGDIRHSVDSSILQVGSDGQTSPTVTRHPSQSSCETKNDSSGTGQPEDGSESPTLSHRFATSSSQTQLQDTDKAGKSSNPKSPADVSGPSLPLSSCESIPERLSSSRLHFGRSVTSLRLPDDLADDKQNKLLRYVYLLHNDLIFERFLKQQHLAHIGELKRRHVQIEASEAETQNIINANKHLRQRLEEAKKAEIQAKTEADKSRTLAKKREADIFSKLKTLREEQKKWNVEGASLRGELGATKEEAEELRKMVCEVEVRELKLKQNIASADISFGELERLKSEVARLSDSERHYQAKENERQAAMTRAAEADGRARGAKAELAAREADFQHTVAQYDSQIAELNSKLRDALKFGGRRTERIETELRAALDANKTAHAEMTTRIKDLTRRNTELETLNFELQTDIASLSKPLSRPGTFEASDLSPTRRSLPDLMKRLSQGSSEPSAATSHNVTPQLQALGTAISQGRPSTPPGVDGPSRRRDSLSPKIERRPSRGGADNSRKDKNEKKEDRERKKATGLRGIRGFY
ncbi:hypothetical protein GGR50DRAFT_114984 [Xylaria sp. CBS 124048]|nr:hypothetical protein GGR50DRAFT_114984 [Xylaria sp. CBS 124048]